MRLNQLLGAMILAGASSVLAAPAIAQQSPFSPPPVPVNPRTLGIENEPVPPPPGVVPFSPTTPSAVPVSPRTLGIDAAPAGFEPIRVEPIPEVFNRTVFQESGDLYFNSTIGRQIEFILGLGSLDQAAYPDLEIVRDAQRINNLYRELLETQVSSDPVIRTPDLPNPFDTSLLRQPGPLPYTIPVEGSEFIFETVPPLR